MYSCPALKSTLQEFPPLSPHSKASIKKRVLKDFHSSIPEAIKGLKTTVRKEKIAGD
jgi:hypothetical protein